TAWMQRTMIDALASPDEPTLKRAIEAVREAKLDAKLDPLAKIAADRNRPEKLRAAALDALANHPGSRDTLVASLNDTGSMILRKRAAELLGQSGDRSVAAPLLAALRVAPWELATAIAGSLAKTDGGCEQLLALIESGKASPALLRNNAVAG